MFSECDTSRVKMLLEASEREYTLASETEDNHVHHHIEVVPGGVGK